MNSEHENRMVELTSMILDEMREMKKEQRITNVRLEAVENQQKITNQRLGALEDQQKITNQRLTAVEDQQKITNQRLGALEDQQKITNQRLGSVEYVVSLERKEFRNRIEMLESSVAELKGFH
jgi:uncharacterized protein (DUF3084 family)